MTERPVRPLPVTEDMRFQKAAWIVERIGWGVFAVVIVLGLCGVFSRGYLSQSAASVPDSSFAIQFERFQRVSVLTRLFITVTPHEDEARVHFNAAFQEAYEIEAVEPRPVRTSAGQNGFDFYFEPTSGEALNIVLWARPRRIGLLSLEVAGPGAASLPFRVFVYP